MKLAAFEFKRATSLAGAVARLAEGGAEAKVIVGDQSLVSMTAMQLAHPIGPWWAAAVSNGAQAA